MRLHVERDDMNKAPSSPLQGLKIYDEARSAHLERALSGGMTHRLLYRKASYDFDAELARTSGSTITSLIGVSRAVFASDVQCVELNEPLFLRAIPLIIAAFFGGWLRSLCKGNRPKFVTYAIENIDMAAKLSSHTRVPSPIIRVMCRTLLRWIFSCFDRVAFGTQSSKRAYEDLFGLLPSNVEVQLFPAIEPLCDHCELAKSQGQVLFLGAFDDRKGVDTVMMAWPIVQSKMPGARLILVGKGRLSQEVVEWSNAFTGVEVQIDPPRRQIHDALSASVVLVLPSRGSVRWREQVGLPIVEGLSHGCKVVTTRDTGLAEWLREHNHIILASADDEAELAEAILAAISAYSDALSVTRSLPARSGRLDAEAWLWRA